MFGFTLVVMLVNGSHMRMLLDDFGHVHFDMNTEINIQQNNVTTLNDLAHSWFVK